MTAAAQRHPRVRLASLDPDAFLAWAWRAGPRERGTSALTLDDVWFELARLNPDLKLEDLRRDYMRLASRVRRNQRLGLEPFSGIVR